MRLTLQIENFVFVFGLHTFRLLGKIILLGTCPVSPCKLKLIVTIH